MLWGVSNQINQWFVTLYDTEPSGTYYFDIYNYSTRQKQRLSVTFVTAYERYQLVQITLPVLAKGEYEYTFVVDKSGDEIEVEKGILHIFA